MPKVGDTIWMFDQNRRKYAEPTPEEKAKGKIWGDLIYRGHFREVKIASETSRSWVTEWGAKIPKRGDHPGFYFTEQEVDDACWARSHRYKISERIGKTWGPEQVDVPTLREIARLIGYKAE